MCLLTVAVDVDFNVPFAQDRMTKKFCVCIRYSKKSVCCSMITKLTYSMKGEVLVVYYFESLPLNIARDWARILLPEIRVPMSKLRIVAAVIFVSIFFPSS